VHKLPCRTDRNPTGLRKTSTVHNIKTLKGKDRIWKLLIQHIIVFGAAKYTDVGLAWYKTSKYEHKAASSWHITESKHQKYSLGDNRTIQPVTKFLASYGTRGFITVYTKHILTPRKNNFNINLATVLTRRSTM